MVTADVLIFPTRMVATRKQRRMLVISNLEVEIQQYEAAAADAERLADRCVNPVGKRQHEKVADYFRLHAAFARQELEEMTGEAN